MNKEETTKEIIDYLLKENPSYKVKNIYLWGSRWFGSFHEKSDYDFFILLEGYEQEEFQFVRHYKSKNGLDFDLVLYNYTLFINELSHEMWAVPIFFVQEQDAFLYSKLPFELKIMKLRKRIGVNVRKNLEPAVAQFQKEQLKSRKRVVYVLRYLGFSYQVITNGRITDWVQDYKFFQNLVQTTYNSWKDFEKEWSHIYKKYDDTLYGILNQFKKYNEMPKNVLNTFDFIQDRGLKSLYLDLSIDIIKIKENHYFFSHVDHESPKNVNVVRECCGLIVDISNIESPTSLSCPPKMILEHTHKYKEEVDWNTSDIYIFYDGVICTMYLYNNEWKVSNEGSFDSNNKMKNGKTISESFWKIWNDKNYEIPNKKDNSCYYFLLIDDPEFINPNFKDILCFGWRDLESLKEKHPKELKYKWNFITKIEKPDNLKSLEKLTHFQVKEKGFLLIDEKFNKTLVESQLSKNLRTLLEEKEVVNKEFIHLLIIIQSHDSKFLSDDFPIKSEKDLYKYIRLHFHRLKDDVNEILLNLPLECQSSKQVFIKYIEKYPRLVKQILNVISYFELRSFEDMFFYTNHPAVLERKIKMIEKGFMEWVNEKK